MEPQEIAIMHCPGHQRAEGLISQGDNKADQASTLAAWTETITSLMAALTPDVDLTLAQLVYSLEDLERAKECGFTTHQKDA